MEDINDNDSIVRNLSTSLEKEDEFNFDEMNDILQIADTSHSYLSPVTTKLHQEIRDTSQSNINMYDEESVLYTKKNIIQGITYIMDHGDPIKNTRCATIIHDLEKYIMEAKLKIQSEVYITPKKTGLSFPAFTKKETKKDSKET